MNAPIKIKIPKVNPDLLYEFEIRRDKIIEVNKWKFSALRVFLKKQIFMGIEIPVDFEVFIRNASIESIKNKFSHNCKINIHGHQVNQILRTLTIDKLRKNG